MEQIAQRETWAAHKVLIVLSRDFQAELRPLKAIKTLRKLGARGICEAPHRPQDRRCGAKIQPVDQIYRTENTAVPPGEICERQLHAAI
jgi:hypothetical protein